MTSALRSRLNMRSVTRLNAGRLFSTAVPRRSAQPYFADEPTAPSVRTAIPGPKNQAAAKELSEVFDTRSLNLLADYEKSVGN